MLSKSFISFRIYITYIYFAMLAKFFLEIHRIITVTKILSKMKVILSNYIYSKIIELDSGTSLLCIIPEMCPDFNHF